MTTLSPKLCKDCRWAERLVRDGAPSELSVNWLCHHPSSLQPSPPNLVTGTPYGPNYMNCSTARGRLVNSECCGPEGRHWESKPDIEPELSSVIGFGEALATRDERRENLADSIIEGRPITEDDEGAWEWCSLWPDNTGLPFKIWLCDIAPVVILGDKFPSRAEINDLYRWMRLNDEVLETLGLHSTMEMIKRLRKL